MEKVTIPEQSETTTVSINPDPSSKVYVCHLPSNILEEEVKQMFKKFGNITLFKLLKRKDGFTYSYITYQTIQQARKAIAKMNKYKIKDKTLKVSFAVENCQPKAKKLQKKKGADKFPTKSQFPQVVNRQEKKKMKNDKKLRKNQEKHQQSEKRLETIVQVSLYKEESKVAQYKYQTTIRIQDHNSLLQWLKQKKEETEDSAKTTTEWGEYLDTVGLQKKSKKKTF